MIVFFRAVRTVPLFFIMMLTTRRDDRVKHLKKSKYPYSCLKIIFMHFDKGMYEARFA